MQEVAAAHGVTVEQLVGHSRRPRFVRPRHEAMWRVRQLGRFSLPQVAGWFGMKDHTSALHGCRRHEELSTIVLADPVDNCPEGICSNAVFNDHA
jgi:chromosomal replication initiator protein